MLKTQKIKSTNEKPIEVPGFKTINVLKWNNSKWKTLCPYFLKTDGNESNSNPGGILFENFYQGSKVYDRVYPIEVYPSRFQQGNPAYLWWKYDAPETGHKIYGKLGEEQFNFQRYKEWRDSLWNCKNPIRYPNGFTHKRDVEFSLSVDAEGNQTRMDYITARKEIYIKEYIRLIKQTSQYYELLEMLKEGKNLLICEVDVPDFVTTMTLEILEVLMNDGSKSFGHGLCLTYSLLTDIQETQNYGNAPQ